MFLKRICLLLLLFGVAVTGCRHTGLSHAPSPGVQVIQRHPENSGDLAPSVKTVTADYLSLARDMLASRHDDAALVLLEKAEAGPAGPHNAGEILFLKGEIARRGERREEALGWYRACLAQDPGYADAYNGLGLLQAHGGIESLTLFREAVRRAPDHPEFSQNLGVALMAAGRYEEALPMLEKSLASDPADMRAVNNLAVCLGFSGEPGTALAHLEKHQRPAEARNNMGVIYQMLGRRDLALQMFRQAVALDPNMETATFNLGQALKAERE